MDVFLPWDEYRVLGSEWSDCCLVDVKVLGLDWNASVKVGIGVGVFCARVRVATRGRRRMERRLVEESTWGYRSDRKQNL